MNKFFDFLENDLSIPTIRELGRYIRRYVFAMNEEIPVEGKMGKLAFCAKAGESGNVHVFWVQIGRERIPVNATI